MKLQKHVLAITLSLMLCLSVANAARITVTTNESESLTSKSVCVPDIFFDGEIEAKDLDTLKRIVDKTCAEVKKNPNGVIEYKLRINSDGGDVDAALAIGRFIRNINLPVKKVFFHVDVWKRDRCYSSCVFILAAGARRTLFGDVGIHRPYFVQLDTKYSAEEIRRIRLVQSKNIKAYLIEMDVAESLLDAMLAVPAEQIKVLTQNELTHYRLTGDDANFEERNTAEKARLWYLNSSQYRLRNEVVKKQCGYFHEKYKDDAESFWRCEATIMLQISAAEYEVRYQKQTAECFTPDIEKDEQAQLECMYRIRAGK
ncbi:hypothetical protein MCERE10_02569 [Burkholderiaceae bacterium]